VFDVGAIVGEVASAHLAPSATPLQSSLIPGDAARVRLTGGGEPSRAIDVDFLAQLVNEAAEGAVDVAAEGSRLWVRGDAAAHAKVSALLAAARAACGDAVVVRLALVDGTPPKAVLNAVETAAFLSQNPPRFEVAATGATDFPFAIRSGRDISFVGDYDVEVAQKSGVSDPGIRVLPVGVSAVVGALASPDGRLLLRLAGTYTTADVRPRTASAGEASKFGDLETPEATSVAVAGSAAIENGGCFVVGAAAAGGFWIATASRVRPYPESAEAGFVPCAALVRSSFDLGPMGVDADFFSGAGPGPIGEGRDEPTSLIVDDRLMALVKEGAPSEENGAGVSMTQGGRLALRGPESYRKAVRSAASKLAAGLLRNAQAEIRFGVVGAPEAAGLMGGGEAGSAAPRPHGRRGAERRAVPRGGGNGTRLRDGRRRRDRAGVDHDGPGRPVGLRGRRLRRRSGARRERRGVAVGQVLPLGGRRAAAGAPHAGRRRDQRRASRADPPDGARDALRRRVAPARRDEREGRRLRRHGAQPPLTAASTGRRAAPLRAARRPASCTLPARAASFAALRTNAANAKDVSMKARRAAPGAALAAALWAAAASGQEPRTPETRRTVDVSTVVKLPDRASDDAPWAPATPPLAGAVGWFWHHGVGAPYAYGLDENAAEGRPPVLFPGGGGPAGFAARRAA
jgi:hypothetical protein